MKNIWLWLIIPIFVVAVFLALKLVEDYPMQPEEDKPIQSEVIEVILVGDIMLDRGVEYMVDKYGQGDFHFPFLKISETLKEADIVLANLEGPISDLGVMVGSIYSFRAEPEAIEGLTSAGFDILSLANNHAFDYGFYALEDTIVRLQKANMDYIGIGPALIKEIKGTKIAFLAYTNLGSPYWGLNWTDWANLEDIKKEVEETKAKADLVIVSLHAGNEYSPEPTQFQKEFARTAIEGGADLVFGHHPHVVQPNEIYQTKHIFYSLGNFVFDQAFSEGTMKGQMVRVLIEKKEIKEVIPIDIQINNLFQPEVAH